MIYPTHLLYQPEYVKPLECYCVQILKYEMFVGNANHIFKALLSE